MRPPSALRRPSKALRRAVRRVLPAVAWASVRMLAITLALIAGLNGTGRAFAGYRCFEMERRLAEPCCPDELGGAAHEDPADATAHLAGRCCEALPPPALEQVRSDERSPDAPGARRAAPGDVVVIPPPPVAPDAFARPDRLRATRPDRPPGDRLTRTGTILRV